MALPAANIRSGFPCQAPYFPSHFIHRRFLRSKSNRFISLLSHVRCAINLQISAQSPFSRLVLSARFRFQTAYKDSTPYVTSRVAPAHCRVNYIRYTTYCVLRFSQTIFNLSNIYFRVFLPVNRPWAFNVFLDSQPHVQRCVPAPIRFPSGQWLKHKPTAILLNPSPCQPSRRPVSPRWRKMINRHCRYSNQQWRFIASIWQVLI